MDAKDNILQSGKSEVSFLENVGIETEGKSSAYIVTFTPYFKNVARKEMGELDNEIKFERLFGDSIALVTSEYSQEEFLDKMTHKPPIFVKHIMPVMDSGEIKDSLEEDKVELLKSVDKIVDMEEGSKFAVQCRVVSGRLTYSSKDIEVFVGDAYYNRGYVPSFSDREILNEDIYIISILIHGQNYFVGFSKSDKNLNFHSDEHRVCARTGREISRAENKLKEALSTFKVELDGHGTALDLGAAPGGWSKVLADYGYSVKAVDPGELHEDLQNNPKIEHLKCKIETLNFDEEFDLIVNDMNVEPQVTGVIMNGLAHSLKAKGLAIVTLKLPDSPVRSIKEATQILEKEYEVLKIRSLFHNRQEVTALLQKKER